MPSPPRLRNCSSPKSYFSTATNIIRQYEASTSRLMKRPEYMTGAPFSPDYYGWDQLPPYIRFKHADYPSQQYHLNAHSCPKQSLRH